MKKIEVSVYPDQVMALMMSPNWIDCHKYGSLSDVNKGEVGKISDVHFIEKKYEKNTHS